MPHFRLYINTHIHRQRCKEGHIHIDCSVFTERCVSEIPLYQDALFLPHCITHPSYDKRLFYSTCSTFTLFKGQMSPR
ncbi:expressed protein [Echinococcus multilocularis]|uniref:Expressed protein n=1 Tax=Echinococcus multilocularis TaxID=6211 RepID=A0A068YI88_ECHMU|nr:expressed protein [Echinococcus multilocularis]